jgi:hypothetical protein
VSGIRVTLMTGVTKCFTIFYGHFSSFAAAFGYLLVHLEGFPPDTSPASFARGIGIQTMSLLRRFNRSIKHLCSDRPNRVRSVHYSDLILGKVPPRLVIENPDRQTVNTDLGVDLFSHSLSPESS